MPAPSEGEDGLPGGVAEAAALADARGRGEAVAITAALNQVEEETSKKKLPDLREIIPLIPANIQEAMDDIFRARFVRLVRVKKRDLLQP